MNPSRRAFLASSCALVLPILLSRAPGAAASASPVSVRDLGARGDGRTHDTQAIQTAIDTVGPSGATIYFPPGEYLSGTLHLRSRVTIHLDADATLVASKDDGDFDAPEQLPYDPFADRETADFRFALLQGRNLEGVRIVGPGRIDANRTTRGGPKPIALRECRNVRIHDLTISNAANYNISLLGCEDVDIVGITLLNGYSDGIDPDCCRRVRIANCHIESRDDAIALKTSFALGERRSTRDVAVTGCHLTSMHNGLKLGTESTGDFKGIDLRNCTIVGRSHPWKGELSSGVAFESVDGGNLQDIRVSNLRMASVRTPVFIRLGERGRAQPRREAGTLKNVSLANIVAGDAPMASSITGVPGRSVSGVSLKNIRVTARGGGKAVVAPPDVPELERTYPDAYMFKDLPAYGLYCRHVRGLTLDRIDFDLALPDRRAAVVLDDVHDARVRAVRATPPEGEEPVFWLRSVQDCLLQGVRSRGATRTFLRLSGPGTARIRLVANDLNQVETVMRRDADVAATAFRMLGDTAPR